MKNNEQDYEEHQDDVESTRAILEMEQTTCSNRKPLNKQPAYGKLISAKVILQSNNASQKGKVMRRSTLLEGVIVGFYDENPKLKSIVHDVELSDGQVKECAANVMTKITLIKFNSEGFSLTLT